MLIPPIPLFKSSKVANLDKSGISKLGRSIPERISSINASLSMLGGLGILMFFIISFINISLSILGGRSILS